jgi:hypothetical protein
VWVEFLSAAIVAHKPETPDDMDGCGDLADQAYIQMMLRESAG